MRPDFSDQHWEWFEFDGVKSCDYGVWISGEATFDAPERDVEVIEIPGRNGTLTIDNGRWKNITVTYPCFMSGTFKEGFDAFKNAILPKYGYLELRDTYHPHGFRKARITKGIQPATGPYNRSAQFDITFDCWPQFYLDELDVLYPENIYIGGGTGTIQDVPLVSRSQPLVQVYFSAPMTYGNKSGYVQFGENKITFTDVPYAANDTTFFEIDSESKTIQHRKSGNTVVDISEYCTIEGGFFEILPPSTEVVSSGVLSLIVFPRWWQL